MDKKQKLINEKQVAEKLHVSQARISAYLKSHPGFKSLVTYKMGNQRMFGHEAVGILKRDFYLNGLKKFPLKIRVARLEKAVYELREDDRDHEIDAECFDEMSKSHSSELKSLLHFTMLLAHRTLPFRVHDAKKRFVRFGKKMHVSKMHKQLAKAFAKKSSQED